LLIKYMKSVFWRVAKCLSYIEEVQCLKVKLVLTLRFIAVIIYTKQHFTENFSLTYEYILGTAVAQG
jgi:hypothetical protein